jgi:hypothetical protein
MSDTPQRAAVCLVLSIVGLGKERTRALALVVALGALLLAMVVPSGAATQSFSSWRSVDPSMDYASEPGVWVAPNGTIFVVAPPTGLWRSTDHGVHFSRVDFKVPASLVLGGFDSDFALRGNSLYYFDLWVGSSTLLRSKDFGKKWELASVVSTPTASDRQWIALGPRAANGNDTIYTLSALIQPPQQVMFSRSRDSGSTFDFVTPAPAILQAKGSTSRLVSDGKYVAFAWEDLGVLSVAYSSDEGATWRTSRVAEDVQGVIPSIALDGANLYVAWGDTFFKSTKVAVSRNRGKTWSGGRTVSGSTNTVFPWIDARAGKVAIAYYGASIDQTYTSDEAPSSANWTARYVESLDGGRTYSSPIVAGPGKRGPICTYGVTCDEGRELGDFLGVTIEPGTYKRSVVVFGGSVSGGLKLARQR